MEKSREVSELGELPAGVITGGYSDRVLLDRLESYRISVTKADKLVPSLKWLPERDPAIRTLREELVSLLEAEGEPSQPQDFFQRLTSVLRNLPEYRIPVWLAGLISFFFWGVTR